MAGTQKLKLVRVCVAWLLLSAVGADAADDIATAPGGRREIREQGLVVSLSPRTPDQMYAFYFARGFPEDALQEIARHCFLTIGLRNERNDIVWLELDRWRFIDDRGREHARHARKHWNTLWERLKLASAKRATFGWTQLPEQRDLHPGEPVGGNISLNPPGSLFTIEARLATGADKRGPELRLRFDNVSCPRGTDR
jgi:hypothetical protein